MRSMNSVITVETEEKQRLLDLTGCLKQKVDSAGIRDGVVGVYCQHTTAAVFISESQAALTHDIAEFFGSVVADDHPYRHNSPEFSDCDRKNAASHLRALLLGQSVLLPVVEGKPVLGQFQSVLFAEFDGPRRRELHVQVFGE
jgi:secondary thiamine-phosphate synthase enzyme